MRTKDTEITWTHTLEPSVRHSAVLKGNTLSIVIFEVEGSHPFLLCFNANYFGKVTLFDKSYRSFKAAERKAKKIIHALELL